MKRFMLFFVAGLMLFSCKKDNTPNNGVQSNTNNSSGSSAPAVYGILIMNSVRSVSGGVLSSPFYLPQAYFSNSLSSVINTSTYTKVYNVSVNGTYLKFQAYMYQDTTYAVTIPPAQWVVNGLGVIPTFSYTNTTAMPGYTGYASLPDSVNHSQALTLSITGTSGTDEVDIILYDNSGLPGHTISQKLASGATSVTFPASGMSALNVGAGNIDIDLIKNNAQSFSGKPFNFQNSLQVTKQVYIK